MPVARARTGVQVTLTIGIGATGAGGSIAQHIVQRMQGRLKPLAIRKGGAWSRLVWSFQPRHLKGGGRDGGEGGGRRRATGKATTVLGVSLR